MGRPPRLRGSWKTCWPLLASGMIAACGGSSSPAAKNAGSRPPSGPTRAQFIAEADQICHGAAARLAVQQHIIDAAVQTDQSHDSPANRSALANALRKDEALATPQLDRLRGLTPVAGDQVVLATYLAGVASQIQLIGQFATAVENKDASALSTIAQQLTQGKATVDGLAQRYGFKVCGTPHG